MPVRPRWRRRLRAWMRRTAFPWWAFGGVLALVTGVTVHSSLDAARAASVRFGALRTVPVVAEPVAAGGAVDAGAVRWEPRPSSMVPDGEVASGSRRGVWTARVARVPLVPGEVLLASKLAPDGLRGAAALLPPGMRALAVPDGPGGRPPVEIGDHVDVLATVQDGASGTAPTITVATAALVVAIDAEHGAVTVAVTPEEAPAVAYAVNAAAVTLALTSP